MTVRPGDAIPSWEISDVSREKMKTMAALLADSNPIHFDLESVRKLGMGTRPVNQGPSNLAYLMNMLAAWTGGHEHLRKVTVRFRSNVLGDDHVIARGTVTDVREKDGRVLADCEVELLVEGRDTALSGTATVDVTHMTERP
ncbi:MaoC family dehydratase [Streptomyces carpinensis]|uniref:MaoC family dehydratase n=1 Tax=Streptomyces carpinensis TaxID=66369 RepID=A0ABV1WAK6_9ACTN|nr:MaoC family dehydratase [Streptomyces carpinensis]